MDANDIKRWVTDGLDNAKQAGDAEPTVRNAQHFFVYWMVRCLGVVAAIGFLAGLVTNGPLGAAAGIAAAIFIMIPVGIVIAVLSVTRTMANKNQDEKDRW